MKILLCCAAGMSTSLLVNKMQDQAKIDNMECEIFAIPADEISKYIDNYDVILIGPQIRYKEKHIRAIADEHGKGCGLIDPVSYGTVNGKKVLAQALSLKK